LHGQWGCVVGLDEYDGTNLNVAIADNSTTRPANLISYPIDIPSLLGQTSAFAGFTAGTGSGYQNHIVGNWHFSETPGAANSMQQ